MPPRAPWLLPLAVLAACRGGGPRVAHRAEPGDVAIVGATVVPMSREGTLAGHTVLLRGDRIVAVAPAATIDTRAATVVDASGRWVLPGLADMHVHLWGERDLDLFVLNGVTTVRNLFGAPTHLRWRDAIARGERVGPTLITAGPILDGDPPTWPGSAVVTTPDAARAEVQAEKAAGYDWIKVYGGLAPDVYAAVLDEAGTQGLPVGGHVPPAVGIDTVITSGQRSIEHLDGYVPFADEPQVERTIEPTVRAGVWNCPTLVVTDRMGHLDHPERLAGTRGLDLVSPAVRAQWDPRQDFRLASWTPERFETMRARNQVRRTLVRDLQAAGAHLVLGTDTGNPYVVPGFAVVDELGLLVASGLTPWQALRTATAAAAELQGTPGAFGVVAAGARADLLVVGADPLADVGNAADPSLVVVRGKVYRRDELLAAAQLPATPADPFADRPALVEEGALRYRARYDVLMGDVVVGGERVVVSKAAGGALVVHGQLVFTSPQAMWMSYRSTRDRLDLESDSIEPPQAAVTRAGKTVVARQAGRPDVVHAGAPGDVIAAQAIAEYVWYAHALADLAVGAHRTLTAAEVRAEGTLSIVPGRFTFTRSPDADDRRVYTVTGTHGDLDLTGRFTVDPDGAPAEVTITVTFGTFTTRRTD